MVAVAWAGLQKAIPIIGRLLWDIGHLMLQAVGAWFVGVTTAARRMGEEAVAKAANKGVPSDYELSHLLVGDGLCRRGTADRLDNLFLCDGLADRDDFPLVICKSGGKVGHHPSPPTQGHQYEASTS